MSGPVMREVSAARQREAVDNFLSLLERLLGDSTYAMGTLRKNVSRECEAEGVKDLQEAVERAYWACLAVDDALLMVRHRLEIERGEQ
jgi:hypothetical protein